MADYEKHPDFDANVIVAKADAVGYVSTTDGKFVCCRTRKDGTSMCGARMKNHPTSIGSHVTKIHKENSAYDKNTDKTKEFQCTLCRRRVKGFHAYQSHVHDRHDVKGSSTDLHKDEVAQKMPTCAQVKRAGNKRTPLPDRPKKRGSGGGN